MKLDRMLSIITYLLNHEKAKAHELANKLEVSVRTIYRDVDAIAQAGIPITTYQGADGGIGIVEGFKLDKGLLSNNEVLSIVAGLKGINSISEDVKIELLIEKLTGVTTNTEYMPIGNEIMIDLSPWNKNNQLADKIKQLKRTIRERRFVEFLYYSNDHSTKRRVEPHVIVFKETNWYLYAFCLLRNDFRLFKLRRINELSVTENSFKIREFSLDRIEWEGEFEDKNDELIVALFDKSMKYTVNDIFGVNNYETLEDESIKVSFSYGQNSWIYGFLLSFGDKVEVLSPDKLRQRIKEMAVNISRVYD
jgi:predicted DNA-binding transcriptional regulator YafY